MRHLCWRLLTVATSRPRLAGRRRTPLLLQLEGSAAGIETRPIWFELKRGNKSDIDRRRKIQLEFPLLTQVYKVICKLLGLRLEGRHPFLLSVLTSKRQVSRFKMMDPTSPSETLCRRLFESG